MTPVVLPRMARRRTRRMGASLADFAVFVILALILLVQFRRG